MSVKKIGKTVIQFALSRYYYGTEGSGDRFSASALLISNFAEFQSLEKRPETTRDMNDAERDKRWQEQKEYKAKRDVVVEAVRKRLDEECYKKPMRLAFMKDWVVRQQSPLVYCAYKGVIYKFDRVGYTDEEIILQIMNLEDDERKKFERLKHKFTVAEQEEKEGKRPAIPEEVRIAVWRRDDGKCVKCGSRERLEYDHIIPLSKGGSNTVRNIELLCEKCNREKSGNIG